MKNENGRQMFACRFSLLAIRCLCLNFQFSIPNWEKMCIFAPQIAGPFYRSALVVERKVRAARATMLPNGKALVWL